MDLLLAVFFISLLILVSGAFFKLIENIFLSGPLLAIVLGIILGPQVLDIFTIKSLNEYGILKLASEFTMAMALMATALRLPGRFFTNNYKNLSLIIGIGMLLMWGFSTVIFYWLVPGLGIFESLLIAAIVTPTDPVISSTIVTGKKAQKYLPEKVRNIISFESGANDGLAYPLVIIGILLLTEKTSGFPLTTFLLRNVLYDVILCGIIAFIIGYLSGELMHKANKMKFMNSKSVLPFSLALALLLLSGLNILGMNGIFGVFIGGLGFASHISKNEDLKEERIQESMERIFTIPVFFFLGLFLPWAEWSSMGWTAVLIVIAILCFRRIPAFLLLMPLLSREISKTKNMVFMGWFGPIGVAATFYAMHSVEKTDMEEMWIISSLIIFASTLAHGISSVPLERLYSKK